MAAKVTLISHMQYPVETIYTLWTASRTTTPTLSVKEVAEKANEDKDFAHEVSTVFSQVILNDIPIAENLDFVFLLEDIPVSLREQLVRHRVGHKFGENFTIDILPELASSSWWSQTMRILDMGNFFTEGRYYCPESMKGNPEFVRALTTIEHAYKKMVKAGIPVEDARQILPLATTSRISWKVNCRAIGHLMRNRSCWIAQLGMWKPIIMGVVSTLCNSVHPVFRSLATPPCIDAEGFIGCPYTKDCLERVHNITDPGIPCPLFLNHHRNEVFKSLSSEQRNYHPCGAMTWDCEAGHSRTMFKEMQEEYGEFWGRNVWTGEEV